MITSVFNLSRQEMEQEISAGSVELAISISDPNQPFIVFPPNIPVLFLKFHDIEGEPGQSDQEIKDDFTKPVVLFSESMAQQVVSFIKTHNTNPSKSQTLFVNCEMGISRSGAVTWFVKHLLDLDTPVNSRTKPNNRVLNKLMKQQ